MINIQKIKEENLEKIKGGEGFTIWAGIVVAGIIIFVSGLIDGIVNPRGCNE